MATYADELRMLADASEPDAARILRGAADALDDAAMLTRAGTMHLPIASAARCETYARLIIGIRETVERAPPAPAIAGHWRTLPDHLPVTREAVSLATGHPIGFVTACENDPEGSLCGPAPRSGFKTAGQWFEFVREARP